MKNTKKYPGNAYIYIISWVVLKEAGYKSPEVAEWRARIPGKPWYGYGDNPKDALKKMREIIEKRNGG